MTADKRSPLLNRDDICSVVESYLNHLNEHEIDELVALYAEDAVKHEPLGVASYHGQEAIREFDVQSASTGFSVTRHSPITVSGRFAAVQARVQFDGVPDFLATDLFEFDERGKITSLSVLIDIEARP